MQEDELPDVTVIYPPDPDRKVDDLLQLEILNDPSLPFRTRSAQERAEIMKEISEEYITIMWKETGVRVRRLSVEPTSDGPRITISYQYLNRETGQWEIKE